MLESTAAKFTNARDIQPLDGGQNASVRVGNIVLKPVNDPEKYEWVAAAVENLEFSAVNYAKPVRSILGNWIEDGWGATQHLPGTFLKGKISEKLEAAKRFHEIVSAIKTPANFDLWQNPWSLASKVAWKELDLPSSVHEESKRFVAKLLDHCEELGLPSQLIHSDLAGNILFHEADPFVIDLSPDFRPVEYTLTMLVTDSVAWHGEPLESLQKLPLRPEEKRQLTLRAVIFRLCVPLFFNGTNRKAFLKEVQNFTKVLNFLEVL